MNPNREEALFALALEKPAAERAVLLVRERIDLPMVTERIPHDRR